MNPQTNSTATRLRIWQQNLNKSNKAQFNLINSPLHNEWDVLLLQEPYIDSFGNTRANHHWQVIYPSTHLANSSVKRSIILVNTRLDTNSWSQIRVEGLNDITAIQISHPHGKTSIFNIYNDCNNSDMMTVLDNYLQKECNTILGTEVNSMMWCGDFNHHHPMWDKECNSHLFTATAHHAAEELISLLADHHMVMTLPRRIPTMQSMSTKKLDSGQQCILHGQYVRHGDEMRHEPAITRARHRPHANPHSNRYTSSSCH